MLKSGTPRWNQGLPRTYCGQPAVTRELAAAAVAVAALQQPTQQLQGKLKASCLEEAEGGKMTSAASLNDAHQRKAADRFC